MTDEAKEMDARVNRVNEAVRKLSSIAYEMVIETGKPKSDFDKAEIVETIHSIGVLFGTVVVSLSEIAYHVGRIAQQGEQDLRSAVDAAAEQKAEGLVQERSKRSFIGQPRKSD